MRKFLALSLLIAGLAPAQNNSSIQASGEEVLVDVVVRDKNARPVNNLPRSAFTVLDDGEAREISGFRLVKGSTAATPADPAGEVKLDPLRQIRLITLVFDRLEIGERALARQAALDLLKNDLPRNFYVSVFALGNDLQAIQPFTKRRDLLQKAVERATSGPSAGFARDSEQIRMEAEQQIGPNVSGVQDLFTRSQQMSGDPFEKIMARLTLDMLSLSERSETAYSGRSTVWALLAGVQGQSQLPGRKAFVYFSDGFAIPQGAEEEFQAVISSANRNNLSFYPVDAHGLSTTRQNQKATESLSAGVEGTALSATLGTTLGASSLQIAQGEDNARYANRLNTQDTLAILADQTGGFLTANTNDFRDPMRRMLDEMDTFYEISYRPHIENYDGRFRHIAVKVDRSDLRVQAKAGYFALPPEILHASALNTYEMPLLKALSDEVPNRDLPFEAGGLHFKGDGRFETCGFLFDMPLSNVTLSPTPDKTKMTGGLAYEALIKDVKGRVVKKLQGEMPVEVLPDQLISFKQGRFTDMEYFDLAPGYYTINAAVLDRATARTSSRRNAFFVPKQSAGLAMSSVVLIRKWRPKEAEASADDPFVVGEQTVTPTLVPRINKSVSTSLPLYVVVYPNPDNPAKPEISFEFNRDGNNKRVGLAAQLDKADAQGRIQYIGNAPIEQFAPGNYAIRVMVKQGTETTQESVAIDLQP